MNRRSFLAYATIAVAMPGIARATGQSYTPGLVDRLLAEGRTVFLDFKTDWCTTCAAQARVIGSVLAENPAYAENVSFVTVDWDQHSNRALSKRLRIPRRSTLVVLKGDQELGRIVAGTSRRQIKALIDAALAAAVT